MRSDQPPRSLLQRTGWARYRGEGRRTSCFFSSRGRHSIFDCDWSSDGCSSDLEETELSADPTRFVIIGNGAAGTYAAEQLRKDDAAAEIVMIDDEKYTLYNRVSLPRYLRGVLLEQRVYVRDMPWHEKNRIDLRLETKVTQVNFEEKTVALDPGGELPYDRLLIATGGRPNPLKVPGAESAKYLFNFQYFDETKAMVARIPD